VKKVCGQKLEVLCPLTSRNCSTNCAWIKGKRCAISYIADAIGDLSLLELKKSR